VWSATARRAPSRAKSAVGDGEFGRDRQTSVLQIEQQFTSILRALTRAVGNAEQLLPALRRRADDGQDALLGVVKTGLQVNFGTIRAAAWAFLSKSFATKMPRTSTAVGSVV